VAAKLPERDDSNPEIERMWAMRRVDALLADQRAQGVDGKHRPEIVRLCEGFSIVSPYASFIVLENDAEYQRWSIERRNATRVTRDRSAQQLVRRELQRLRDQAVANIGPAAERSDRDVLAQAKSHAGAPSDPASGPFDPSASAPGNSTPADDSPGFDFSIPGSTGSGAGGGAVDPVTALIVLSAAGAAWTARRRRRS
jgi:Ca-activated chloride channel family protein